MNIYKLFRMVELNIFIRNLKYLEKLLIFKGKFEK